MATLEKKLADQLANALSDRRFRPSFLPAHIVEMPWETQEQFAEVIVHVLSYWSIQYRYNNYSSTPAEVGSLANALTEAYEQWKGD